MSTSPVSGSAGAERYFFTQTMEAQFLKAFPATDPALLAAYREAGFDVKRPLPAYEYAIWRRCLTVQRQHFFPALTVEEGCEQLGRQYSANYLDTPIGRAVSVLLTVLSTRRIIDRLGRVFRSGNSFSVVTATDEAPDAVRLDVNDVFSESPRYLVGMLERGFLVFRREVSLTPVRHEGDAASFRVTWR